ncbi:MAG: tetratricopeptide repeat protein [Deltaproteobacteria bacterium]|nr:tetratricopeptide repeat protein [Deltaproteobacteria bacterium]
MPLDETRRPFEEDDRGRVLDPNPERKRFLTELFYKFARGRLSISDLARFPKKKLMRLAEIGYFKYKYGRYQEAMKIFETLIAVDNANPYYHTALGGVYQKMGRYVDAVVEYTRAYRLNPKDLCVFVNRGEIYLKHKNFRKAAEDFRNAIVLDSEGKSLWANRARSLVIALKRNLEMRQRMRKPATPPPPRPRGSRTS